MIWNQQEIGAHTGIEEENPHPLLWRMFLDYKLVPDRSREYECKLN